MDLERQLKIKNEYLKMIYAIGYDYDGCNTVESLKSLIDTLCDYALSAINNDDKTVIFGGKIDDLDFGAPRNILGEEVGQNES